MIYNKSYMHSLSLSVILESVSKSALGEAKDHLICPHHKEGQCTDEWEPDPGHAVE